MLLVIGRCQKASFKYYVLLYNTIDMLNATTEAQKKINKRKEMAKKPKKTNS